MNRYSLLFFVVVVGGVQVACSGQQPITMRHPVNQKTVQCKDESCASRYEAAGYMRLTEAQKAQLGIK
jgi:hypothetical protein